MEPEKDLLSIGEMAKLTGISVQAFRYYERKNIIKPDYVNPDSGYRYYSPSQIFFIQLISNCVNLDVALKELDGLFSSADTNRFREFIEKNTAVAQKKAKLINASIAGYNTVLKRMELANLYSFGEIHARAYGEKTYFLKPLVTPHNGESRIKLFLEMAKEFYGEGFHRTTLDDDLDEVLGFADIGVVARHSQGVVEHSTLIEVTKAMSTPDCIAVPSGTDFFRFDDSSQLDHALDVFREQLAGVDNFMIIETEEPFLSRSKINQPAYELRLVIL